MCGGAGGVYNLQMHHVLLSEDVIYGMSGHCAVCIARPARTQPSLLLLTALLPAPATPAAVLPATSSVLGHDSVPPSPRSTMGASASLDVLPMPSEDVV